MGREASRLLPFYALGAVIACSLKFFYSRAGAEDLNWILAPTSWLIELLTDVRFERELRVGWIGHSHRIILGPSCTGLNFLIITFVALFFSLTHRFKGGVARGAWLSVSLMIAYLVTLATNSVRILAAIHLYAMDIYGGVITPERIHRAEGTVVYTVCLLLTYLTVERALGRPQSSRRKRRVPSALVPLGWYLVITVGLPLVNRAYRLDAGRFLEHSGLVLSICLVLAMMSMGLAIAERRIKCRSADKPRGETAPGC